MQKAQAFSLRLHSESVPRQRMNPEYLMDAVIAVTAHGLK